MLPKTYDPAATEDRIYEMWEKSGAFTANVKSTKTPFTVSMPPPNATGQLHLGHAVMLALEDIFIRFERMRGREALWVPGTDHAAIATNAVVERRLVEEGKTKHDLGREPFLQRVREYVEGSKDTIRRQVRKMGASCDWSRERYTMDPALNRCVNEVFRAMHEDGLIYRGERIVNWCPRCHSTLSDDEVEYEERSEQWYTIQYGPLVIGTARPETKFGDTAVAVHPEDKRYEGYVGKEIEIETAIGKARIKVIADPRVDPTFGTGAIKVTPAHDFVDFEMAREHGIPVRQVIGEDGRMMAAAGPFAGMTTRECREAMVEKMKEKGILLKVEPYTHNLSLCYRCAAIVEPLPKLQWFIDVKKQALTWRGKKMSLKEVMQDVVRSKIITIIPDHFEKSYFHWIDNLRDWCISRQIWWGHRVPVWYCHACQASQTMNAPLAGPSRHVSVVPMTECRTCHSKEHIAQDPDTLDTWFSSALWTWSTLVDPKLAEDPNLSLEDLLKGSPDFVKFHPTDVMETGYDILFFWVARMILMTIYVMQRIRMGKDERDRIPFHTVYLHGLVRTRDGRKMSKSDPETCIDPLEMISKYGADALRLSMIVGQSPGADSRLYEEKIAGYRNFVNKLWNAARFVLLQCEKAGLDSHTLHVERSHVARCTLADRWILSRTQRLIGEGTESLEQYRLSEVGEMLYDFVWSQYCDWYLELSKDTPNVPVLLEVLRTILLLLHPYAPFVTEEIWTRVGEGMLMTQAWPDADQSLQDQEAEDQIRVLMDVVSAVRKLRSDQHIEPSKQIDLILHATEHLELLRLLRPQIVRLAGVRDWTLDAVSRGHANTASVFLKGIEVHVPLEGLVDREKLKKEKEECMQYRDGLRRELGNESFVKRAPSQIVEEKRTKLAEAEEKLWKIEEKLQSSS